jgi:hypothetical protein
MTIRTTGSNSSTFCAAHAFSLSLSLSLSLPLSLSLSRVKFSAHDCTYLVVVEDFYCNATPKALSTRKYGEVTRTHWQAPYNHQLFPCLLCETSRPSSDALNSVAASDL